MLRADLHVHTLYSRDCQTPLEQIVARCLEIGIDCLAVTDHGIIAGGLEMQKIAPFPVIVGQEVLTPSGEIMGLFLTEQVPSRLPLQEAIGCIKAQGGLVGIPHPFDPLRLSALKGRAVEAILPQVDFIEVFNSRNILIWDSARARRLARKHGLPGTAGSDAHTLSEIGTTYVEMPEFDGPEEFLKSLAQGRVNGHRSSLLVHVFSALSRLRRRF